MPARAPSRLCAAPSSSCCPFVFAPPSCLRGVRLQPDLLQPDVTGDPHDRRTAPRGGRRGHVAVAATGGRKGTGPYVPHGGPGPTPPGHESLHVVGPIPVSTYERRASATDDHDLCQRRAGFARNCDLTKNPCKQRFRLEHGGVPRDSGSAVPRRLTRSVEGNRVLLGRLHQRRGGVVLPHADGFLPDRHVAPGPSEAGRAGVPQRVEGLVARSVDGPAGAAGGWGGRDPVACRSVRAHGAERELSRRRAARPWWRERCERCGSSCRWWLL